MTHDLFIMIAYNSDMKEPRPQAGNVEKRIARRIARKRGDVFLRADFSDIGGYDQVGRALRDLVRKESLIKIGLGLYARARPSFRGGKPTPINGLSTLKEGLHRLGVETAPSRADLAYNSGRSEQVPTGRVVALRGKRTRRQIGYDGFFLIFERLRPDRRVEGPKANPRVAASQAPITMREALRLVWLAEKYPILGNGDWRVAKTMESEALERASTALPGPDDLPGFASWIAALRNPKLPGDERDDILSAICDVFDPDRD